MKNSISDNASANQIKLDDGRMLGYSEYGDPEGKPLFYFHGWPSSRLEASGLNKTASELGIRIIATDRPGIGLSDYQKNRKVIDWPKDVIQLADHLKINTFSVIGVSSGGPYALACGYKIPDRIKCLGLAGAIGVMGEKIKEFTYKDEQQIIFLANKIPWLARFFIKKMIRGMKKKPEKSFNEFYRDLPVPDKQVFEEFPEAKQWLLAMVLETNRSGIRGLTHDVKLEGIPLGFNLEDINVEVHIWHGEEDTIVFPAMGYYLAEKIPECKSYFLPDEGHLSLMFNHANKILTTIT